MAESRENVRLVVDTNIIVSALIKSLKIKKLIFSGGLSLYAPAYMFFEIIENYAEFKDKTSLSEDQILYILTQRFPKTIKIIPEFYYKDKLKEAYKIAENFDVKDSPFIALALKLKIPIWTNDKDFIIHALNSERFMALDTIGVEELLDGKSLHEITERLKRKYQS